MQVNNYVSDNFIEHEGKRYARIQIEALREDDDEHLIDEQQNIYSLDFKFITNMGERQIEAEPLTSDIRLIILPIQIRFI